MDASPAVRARRCTCRPSAPREKVAIAESRSSTAAAMASATSNEPVQVQIRAWLQSNYARVMDLFREWDDDNSGAIDKKEFRQAVQVLGLGASREELESLFDSWDADGSGEIAFAEMHALLRQGADPHAPPKEQSPPDAPEQQQPKPKAGKRRTSHFAPSVLSLDIDEASQKGVAEQIREALAANAVRVVDLFREWDADRSGSVSKKEFRKAMPHLGLDVPKAEVDALFDQWDPDGSGSIEIGELNRILRKQAELPTHLRAGAVAVDTSTKNKRTLRKGASGQANVLRGLDIDEESDKSFVEQIKESLAAHETRVIDLFRQWDEDRSGSVSKREFRRALPILGCKVPAKVADAVFDSLDPDGSGQIEYKELNKLLRKGGNTCSLPTIKGLAQENAPAFAPASSSAASLPALGRFRNMVQSHTFVQERAWRRLETRG